MTEKNIRHAAVAGRFYSDSRSELIVQINDWFSEHPPAVPGRIRALLVPHAGYIFSGHTASLAFRCIGEEAARFKRVILVGPSHYVYFSGCALPESDLFETPLGRLKIDTELRTRLAQSERVILSDNIHSREHSLEVQLPFISHLLPKAKIIPLLTGDITPSQIASLLVPLWDNETLLVISSDLSHFHSYDEARSLDRDTCQMIEEGNATLAAEQACGATGVNALLLMTDKKNYQLTRLERINSGDTPAGDKERVVGYVSYAVSEPE